MFKTKTREITDTSKDGVSYDIAFSSEVPLEIAPGVFEVLVHDEGVRLERLAKTGCLLFNHDPDKNIGGVRDVRIENREGRCTIVFDETETGLDKKASWDANNLRGVSLRYEYDSNLVTKETRNGSVYYYVRNWTPLEVSLVTIPADITVGKRDYIEIIDKRRNNMDNNNEDRIKNITGWTSAFNANGENKEVTSLALRSIEDGKSFDDFVAAAKAIAVRSSSRELGLSRKETKNYSLRKAMLGDMTGLEGEIHKTLSEEMGKRGWTPRAEKSVIVPYEIFSDIRSLSSTSLGGGGVFIGNEQPVYGQYKSLPSTVVSAGANVIRDLRGNLPIIRQTGESTVTWLADGEQSSEGTNPTFEAVTLSAKTAVGHQYVTRELLMQSDIDAKLQMDMATVINNTIDYAAYCGTGSDGQPKGLMNYSTSATTINSVTFGAAATYAKVLEMIAGPMGTGTQVDQCQFIISPLTWSKWAAKPVESGSGLFILNPTAKNVLGNSYQVSNKFTTANGHLNKALYGYFRSLIIALWGGVEITWEDITGADYRRCTYRSYLSMDVGVERFEDFCVSTDSAAQ